MQKKFLKPNNPQLRQIANVIPSDRINSKSTQTLIRTMLKIAYGEQKDQNKPIMVGLAAPQIGILKRIILVDIKADGKGEVGDLRIYINPEITWQSKKTAEWYEGCYSTGKVCGIVSRPTSIKIKGYHVKVTPSLRLNLNMVEEEWIGYVARIFQHEIDHLNGKLFTNLIKDPDKLHLVEKEEFPLYRDKEAWRNWPKKASLTKP